MSPKNLKMVVESKSTTFFNRLKSVTLWRLESPAKGASASVVGGKHQQRHQK